MVKGISDEIVIVLIVFSILVVVLVCLLAKGKQVIAERLERRKRHKARAIVRS